MSLYKSHKHFVSGLCSVLFVLAMPAIWTSVAQEIVVENVEFADVLQYPSRDYDHRISYGEDELNFGLLWLPDNRASSPLASPPLLIFIHGGCWLNSFDVEHSFAASTALADAGIAVWSLEYRRTGDAGGGWPGTFDDIKTAIAAKDSLAAYGVDTSQFAIAGHSAGGHLALLAGSGAEQAETIIGLAAIADIDAYGRGSNSCQTATAAFMNAEPDAAPDLYAAANPMEQGLHRNTFFLHGDQDTIVPLSQSQNAQGNLITIAGAGHFDWIHPGTPAFASLLTLLQEQLLQ